MVRLQNPFKLGDDLWDPSHRYETSWLLPPYALAACRAVFGLYGIFVELFSSGWYCTHPSLGGCEQAGDSFSYFTVLTYWGLAFYNLTAAVHTFTYARTGTPLLDRFPRSLQALHAFYYTTVTTYPFIVTAVYWGVIFPGVWFTEEFSGWSNVSQHALNSFFALFEIVVPRTPLPPWVHMVWLIFVLALYLSLAYVTHATKGFYTYTFLDIEKQGSAITAAWIIAIAVAAVVVYLLVRGALWLRLWLTEKKAGMDGRFAGQPAALSSTADVELGNYRSQEPKPIDPHHY
ncbi:hypothetical protein KVR01_006733 [Diaporthe batatas]|uniref:uncharacterized protein n=1 Tax=Diaporthe batatas TaxID=748121 RepID=UPI001D04EEC3|nr:uncharacterized protein KVR01_006733 [Diaporthe batatas]KAG8163436.1 hypothetical protein KVR01_006733 [Diaporthe batatas]